MPTRWAAEALLARVSLYERNWNQAAAYATAVIDSSQSFLVRNLDQVFLAYSGEAIWQLQPVVPGLNTFEGDDFIPSGSTVLPPYAVRSGLLAAFEPGDQRETSWLQADTVNGVIYYYPFKYKVQVAGKITENYTMLRLAEQYLIRAEAMSPGNSIRFISKVRGSRYE